ncbi:hypothetical protein ACTNEQ_05030 [Blautia obeum]|uniref:hypothetical protein n=1 Tax=Blautia obeum TaxID=40520 RepID=UPI003F8CD17B
MRLRRNRIDTFYHKKRVVTKDSEGGTRETYGAATPLEGESWPASGRTQALQYGQKLSYIRNVRLSDSYQIKSDDKGRNVYVFENGAEIQELDGMCILVYGDMEPDYKIVAIKPYQHLLLEVEKL